MLMTSVDRIWKFLTARFGTPFNIIYHDTKRSGVQPKDVQAVLDPHGDTKGTCLGPCISRGPVRPLLVHSEGDKGEKRKKKDETKWNLGKKKRQGNRREGVGGKQVWSKQWCVQMNECDSMGSMMFYWPQEPISAIFEKRVTDRHTDRHMDRRTDGPTDWQTDGPMDGQSLW